MTVFEHIWTMIASMVMCWSVEHWCMCIDLFFSRPLSPGLPHLRLSHDPVTAEPRGHGAYPPMLKALSLTSNNPWRERIYLHETNPNAWFWSPIFESFPGVLPPDPRGGRGPPCPAPSPIPARAFEPPNIYDAPPPLSWSQGPDERNLWNLHRLDGIPMDSVFPVVFGALTRLVRWQEGHKTRK